MAADSAAEQQETPVWEPGDAQTEVYPVAREAPGNDTLNTIDIFGERAFSI